MADHATGRPQASDTTGTSSAPTDQHTATRPPEQLPDVSSGLTDMKGEPIPPRQEVVALVKQRLGDATRPEVVDVVTDSCISMMVIRGTYDSKAKTEAGAETGKALAGQPVDGDKLARWEGEDPRASEIHDLALRLKPVLTQEEAQVLIPKIMSLQEKDCARP